MFQLLSDIFKSYGIVAVIVGVMVFAVVYLYNQNSKLQEELRRLESKRVDDAKQAAEKHLEAVLRLETTTNSLTRTMEMMIGHLSRD